LQLRSEVEGERERYMELKAKLRERNDLLEQEVIDLRDQVGDKERDLKKAKREIDKWQREVAMLKEEIGIMSCTNTQPK
jgi:peptidoglycan hydrolase CwlO-like protein